MIHNRDTTPESRRQGAKLATKFIATLALTSVIVLLTGAVGWWTLSTVSHEIKAMQLAGDGRSAAAMAADLLIRIDEASVGLVACVFLGIVLMVFLYLYLVQSIVRPLQTNARLMSRLAVGDGGEEIPARHLIRNDEIGDLARAIRDVEAFQREEVGLVSNMSAGDFSGIVPVRDPADELGLAIQRMSNTTLETLRRVKAHAEQVMAGCEAIASASGELSANSADITSAVTEISGDMAGIKTLADDCAGMVEQGRRLAGSGGQSVERGYEGIGEMGSVMLNMQSCGDKIVRIAKSIGDIAFQTNLLALNASVEAARAGRHGKGFTIVAQEVRNLSGRTSQAAEETSTLMKETIEQVELAAAIAGRINATFVEMQTNIQESDALMAKIAAASRDQNGGIDQISEILRRMDRSARENMIHVGDVSGKAEHLVRQTGSLRQAMKGFRLESRTPYEDLAHRLPMAITRRKQ